MHAIAVSEVNVRSGFKVGRIFGISIHIDWSWIFIFLLVTWNLAGTVFPSLHPDWVMTINITLGVAASLLFFLSILLHDRRDILRWQLMDSEMTS